MMFGTHESRSFINPKERLMGGSIRPNDGKMDIMNIDARNNWQLAKWFGGQLNHGTHYNLPYNHVLDNASEVRLIPCKISF
jgi:hypothetical protein